MSTYVSERILQLFEVEGVKTMFGIPDPSFVRMFNQAEERGWRVVAPHHEAAGGFMAEGLSRMTGKVGLVVGNQGPGVANLVPAAICAAKEGSPIIFIGGQRKHIADQRVRRGRIQYTQQYKYIEPATKYIGIIEYPEQTDEIVHESIRRALSGRPGPVYIEVPMNSMNAELDLPPPVSREAYRLVRQEASASGVADAIKLISAAAYPILLVGHGAFASRGLDHVGALARKLACPIIETFPQSPAIEGFEDRTFPFGFSPAGIAAVAQSDLVIAIGTEIGEPVRSGEEGHWQKGNTDRKWIYVEKDPLAIGVNRPVDVPLIGDLCDVVPQLVRKLPEAPREPRPELADWIQAHKDYKANALASVPSGSSPIHPARFLVEATRGLPKDCVLVRDGGAVNIYTWTYAQIQPRDVLWSQNFGHLGTGLPHAIGAQLAVGQNRRVVLISGDSAFLFHISELETAVRKNLPILCIVGCDYAWGLEVRVYRGMFGPDTTETEAHWGNQLRLDKIAEGFGAHGEYVDRTEDIAPAVARALASGKPAVVQVVIDGVANARDVPGHDEYKNWYTDFF
ncbi:thiamine pyrophosphate-binding protein [Luteimonas sp. BDR2-5]|uniref:thiamine pyrophosphate-binding protein n=1 Tax=Proluteimonas luteida TaxID=2878685 RepID=UPI001E3E3856